MNFKKVSHCPSVWISSDDERVKGVQISTANFSLLHTWKGERGRVSVKNLMGLLRFHAGLICLWQSNYIFFVSDPFFCVCCLFMALCRAILGITWEIGCLWDVRRIHIYFLVVHTLGLLNGRYGHGNCRLSKSLAVFLRNWIALATIEYTICSLRPDLGPGTRGKLCKTTRERQKAETRACRLVAQTTKTSLSKHHFILLVRITTWLVTKVANLSRFADYFTVDILLHFRFFYTQCNHSTFIRNILRWPSIIRLA